MADQGAIARSLAFTSVVKLVGEYGPVRARANGFNRYSIPTKFYTLPVALGDNNGSISGVVSEVSAGAVPSCLVRLYYRPTGYLVSQQYTNTSGAYAFTGLDSTDLANYYVIALDPDGGTQYNIAALDRMTAKSPAFARTLQPQGPMGSGALGAVVVSNPVNLFMLHGDGADASTTFTDSSPFARAFTAGGNARLSTAQKKFGTASMYFDGTASTLASSSFNSSLIGDFTLAGWVYFVNTWTSNEAMITITTSGVYGNIELLRRSGSGEMALWAGGQYLVDYGAAVSAGSWNHVAVVRQGAVFRLFLNGVQQGSYTDSNGVIQINTTSIVVGSYSSGSGNERLNGYVDDLFLRRDVAMWTSDFTPPTGPMTDI